MIRLFVPDYSIEFFHLCWAFVLSCFDVILAWLLYRNYSLKHAGLYLFCPISFLLTGVHSQIDIITVSLAMLGVFIHRKNWFLAAIIFSFSLSIKQTFLYFPIWILIIPLFGNIKERFRFVFTTYFFLGLYYLPMVISDFNNLFKVLREMSGISVNGHGLEGTSVLREIYMLFFPEGIIKKVFGENISQIAKGYKIIFSMLLLLSGYIFGRKQKSKFDVILFYTLVLTALSPRISIQHLIFPLAYIVVNLDLKISKYYYLFASIIIPFHVENLGGIIGIEKLGPLAYFNRFRSHHLQAIIFLIFLIYCISTYYQNHLQKRES
jgi:hypothetical protein